jgi:outer membrane protein W
MDMQRRLALAAGSIGLAAVLALPAPAFGQSQGPGFLFREPIGTFTVRMGLSRPNATGDPFSFFSNELTLTRSSYLAFDVAGDLAFTVAPRLDVVVSAGWAGSQAPSEMRHWLDANDEPIRQMTTFQRVPLTVSLKYYLRPRGRSVGRFAWVPSSGVVPYVGAGGGLMYSRIHQWGDFVDYTDSTIFSDNFASESWTGTAHVFAGVEVPLGPRFVMSAEARYAYAKTPLGPDFKYFGDMDLSGFSLTVGAGVRF